MLWSSIQGEAPAGAVAGDPTTDPVALAQTTLERLEHYVEDPSRLWKDVAELGLNWGPRLLGAIAVFILGMWLAKLLRGAVRRAMSKARLEPMLANFIANLVHIGLMVFVVIMGMGTLGIPTTGFAAIVAAAGFAIAFALQGSLGNFAAGVMIMIFKPFKTGDFVEGAGKSGVIEDVGIFATIMNTPDNKRIIVPNSELTSSSLINYSANPTRRVDLVFGIGYRDDIDAARAILLRVVAANPRVLKSPAPVVAVSELGESGVLLVCRPWVQSADYWDARFEITEQAKKAFDAGGITIPYPQRDVHLHQA